MNLVNLLSKLQAIETGVKEAKELKGGQKELDKDKDGDIDKHDFAHMRKQKNEDIENVLRGLQAIQEGNVSKMDEDLTSVGMSDQRAAKLILDKIKGLPMRNIQDIEKNVARYLPMVGKAPTDVKHLSVLIYRDLEDMGLLESKEECDKCGKVHEGACKEEDLKECGDMEMSPLTAPTAGINLSPMASAYDDATDAYPGQENGPAEPAEEKPQFTLTIRNGDSNLSMTTDTPDEIIHVMKLAGIPGKAEVKKDEPAAEPGKEKEVEEAWGNTPAATNEKEPKAYGDIRDWGFKGTGKGREGYGDRRAPGQGDNPMSESVMLEEYKRFKAGK